jgi:hypothetical protein
MWPGRGLAPFLKENKVYLQPFPSNCGIQVLCSVTERSFNKRWYDTIPATLKGVASFAQNNTHCRYLIASFNASQEDDYDLSKHFEVCGWEPVMHKEGRVNPNSNNRIWVYILDLRSSKLQALVKKWVK